MWTSIHLLIHFHFFVFLKQSHFELNATEQLFYCVIIIACSTLDQTINHLSKRVISRLISNLGDRLLQL